MMTFTEYLTNFLNYQMESHPRLLLNHQEVLTAMLAAADLVREDWTVRRQAAVDKNLTADERKTIAVALQIDNPILRNSLPIHDRNYPRHLERRYPAA
ncbi:MAG: hypothetical protein BroJett011_62020 [Chloroflexota bacterium]|nr:MAG: hypothetical protein BroJett011_62020 [Chloroflexota bacterium]